MHAAQDSSRPQKQVLNQSIRYHLEYSQGVAVDNATSRQQYTAVALAVRDYSVSRMRDTKATHQRKGSRKVCYLSMEFLIGRLLRNNLDNLGLWEACESAAADEGIVLQDLLEEERDPGLGNGGLGRLAACFLDSMATLGVQGVGYGINYEYGLFEQRIVDGCQRESPDHWFGSGKVWQLEQPEGRQIIPVYGVLEWPQTGTEEPVLPNWVECRHIVGAPAELPIVGHGGEQVNSLRLYTAAATEGFDLNQFYHGEFLRSEKESIEVQAISKVLYPPDHTNQGKELRFLQEYFFVACALGDILGDLISDGHKIEQLADRVAIQLNDTHPAIAIPELMRLLIVDHEMSWDDAWRLCQQTFSYTNHTLLPEALEVWSVGLFKHVLPLHLEIIYRINQQLLDSLSSDENSPAVDHSTISIVGEQGEKHIRMANLAFATAHKVNGVARMHTDLVKSRLAPEFDRLYPEKICNVTNGVTPRRWLKGCNPTLSGLITEVIGGGWVRDLGQLSRLSELDQDSTFQERLFSVKQTNKNEFCDYVGQTLGRALNPHAFLDVQVKRIHEYKRQLLSALHIAHLYLSVVDTGVDLEYPRTFVFAGKAAPGYGFAKLIIQFLGALDQSIRNNSRVADQLSVVFVPDYSVSVAERIIPAADLSEQISTAGYEASGTGNMKLAMNGALTIGTMDGANVEIAEQVGSENIFIFGHGAEELEALCLSGYDPLQWCAPDSTLCRVLNEIAADRFSKNQPGVFMPLVEAIRTHGDQYFIAADFDDYLHTQKRAASRYGDRAWWSSAVARNLAGTGMFSSDRAVRDYCRDVWRIDLPEASEV